ncbi:MAG: AAA family ATPase [Eubacterium sp.]|nr:AAA family ATPase [Eubacterium sp.]
MRPILLKMEAFGSYAGPVTIDFTKAEQNLFLVTGDTGAGKTTIFDAIVFALYGEASSNANKKEGIVLQSQFAPAGTKPSVDLTFEEGGEEYTVTRVPRYLKLLTRGAEKGVGTREVTGEVSLVMPDGSVYPSKETDQKLIELVGLSKPQFMQVAMIAQGEFMQLLRASSNDKKVIFRRLFGTELYQNIADELGLRKKDKEKEIAKIKTFCQAESGHISIPAEFPEASELSGQKELILQGSLAGLPDFMELLDRLSVWMAELEKKTEAEKNLAQKAWMEAGSRVTEAESLSKDYQNLDRAKSFLQVCKGKEERAQEQAGLVRRIRAAYQVKNVFSLYEDSRGQAARMTADLKAREAALPGLEETLAHADAEEKKAKESYEKELAAFSQTEERVNKALTAFARLEQEEKKLQEAEKGLEAAKKAREKADADKRRLEETEKADRKEEESLRIAEKAAVLFQNEKKQFDQIRKDSFELADRIRKLEELDSRKAAADGAYRKARQAYEEAEEGYQKMRRIFLDSQAGILASDLIDGQPCPVCGSLDHPHPKKLDPTEQKVSQESLDIARDSLDGKDREQQKASEQAKILGAERAAADRTYAEAFDRFKNGIASAVPASIDTGYMLSCGPEKKGDAFREILSLWKNSLEEKAKRLQKDLARLSQVRKNLAGMEAAKEKAALDAKAAEEALTGRTGEAEHARASVESTRSELSFRSRKEAEEAGRDAAKDRDLARFAFEKAVSVTKGAKQKRDETSALIGRYKKELPTLEELAAQRAGEYRKAMKAAGFAPEEGEKAEFSREEGTAAGFGEQEWKGLVEKHPEEDADRLQQLLNKFEKDKAAAAEVLKQEEEKIGSRPRPDMEKAKAERDFAGKEYETREKIFSEISQKAAENKRALKALKNQAQSRTKLIEEHTGISELYNLVSGKESGSRMDLETFVQRYYLEKILWSANRRFDEMSGGQFELRMVKDEEAGQGKNRGLDLMVYSNVTGREREIRTLSGGESFMAALSLALGMADRIREDSAAVNLDIMFIDEGFGSLDDHSRDQAVKVLQEMAGGNKLIGIISHVTELKNEIDDQLVVTKDDKGSHVHWA